MNDTEIIQLYFERSDIAIEETAIKYGAYLNQIAFNILRCREDTEEIVQDSYLQVWFAIPPQRPKVFRHFLSRITRNLALNRLKYKGAKRRSIEITELIEELENDLCSAQESAESEWELKLIGELINKFLSEQGKLERIMFVYRYFYFLTMKEIAQKMDIQEHKIKYSLMNMKEIAQKMDIQEHKIKYSLMNTRAKLKNYLESEGIII